jgi:hypothetical protein
MLLPYLAVRIKRPRRVGSLPNFGSLTTFSGLVVCGATMLLLYKQFTLGALLFIMDGTGGTAVVWDRWSQRAGDQLHVTAVGSPVHLTGPETAMLVTHAPLAVLGLAIMAVLTWRRRRLPETNGD